MVLTIPQRVQTDQARSCARSITTSAVNRASFARVKFRVAEFVSQPVASALFGAALRGFCSTASVEHVNGPTLPVISRSYVDTEFHGSLNSPVVNFCGFKRCFAFVALHEVIVGHTRTEHDRTFRTHRDSGTTPTGRSPDACGKSIASRA